MNAKRIIAQLSGGLNDSEAASAACGEADALRVRLLRLLPTLRREDLERLNLARAGSSNSLLGDEIQRRNWDAANALIQQWIIDEKNFCWRALAELNGLLITGRMEPSALRDGPVFTGGHQHVDPDLLPELLEWFDQAASRSGIHPVRRAALVRYWLVSLHPFADGNGRTSTLAADWLLLKDGYPPFCFPTVAAGTVAYTPDGKDWATPERAIMKSIEALRRSFALLGVANHNKQ